MCHSCRLASALFLILAACSPVSPIAPARAVTVTELAPDARLSASCKLSANGKTIPVESWRDIHLASFVADENEKLTLSVNAARPINSHAIHPQSFGLKGTVNGAGDTLTFSLNQSARQASPAYLLIRINGTDELVVLIDPPSPPSAKNAANVCDVTAQPYGADATGERLATRPIQAAVDACSAAGGGIVRIPKGVFRVQTVVLKSDVTLYLDAGTVLRGSNRLTDFTGEFAPKGSTIRKLPPVVQAQNFKNVALLGHGCIDAAQGDFIDATGQPFQVQEKGPYRRKAVHLEDGEGFRAEDLTIRDAGGWCVFLDKVNEVSLSRLKVLTPLWTWSDGIDVCGSNIKIEKCFVYSGDDSFCTKAMHANYPISNIHISDCVVYSLCGALKVGMQGLSEQKDIHFNNIDAIRAGKGLVVEHRPHWTKETDAAAMHDIHFTNIRIDEVGRYKDARRFRGPIYIQSYMPAPIYDVYITNVTVANSGPEKSVIKGHSVENPASNIFVKNLIIGGKPVTSLKDSDFATRNIKDIKLQN
ncbi:MAG: hypothetical protein LBK99_05290 [Opitutaceae bacterium]|jgi:polygalacturonase|nr:hypothetical protein [Opitutaceae bacterium]